MHSLIVALNVPLARNGGAAIRNRQTIRALARVGTVDVVCLGATEVADVEDVATVLAWSRDELHAQRSPVRHVRDRLWRVRPGAHWWIDAYRSAHAMDAVERLVAATDPDLVVASQWQTAEYALAVAGGRRLVFDTHNVEGDLRPALGTDGSRTDRPGSTRPDLGTRRLRHWESRLGAAADEVWVCSDEDAAVWSATYGGHDRLRVVPNTVDLGDPVWSADRDPYRVLLTGTMSYGPNADAAVELVREVLPVVRATVPAAQLEIVGRAPAPAVTALHDPANGVHVVGPVPDMRPHLGSAGVMVVPLRAGGGTRLKILEAMAAGLPVVSTPKGAEGIAVEDGTHVLLADDPGGLARAAAAVMTDRGLAERLARSARRLVEERYCDDALARTVAAATAAMEVR